MEFDPAGSFAPIVDLTQADEDINSHVRPDPTHFSSKHEVWMNRQEAMIESQKQGFKVFKEIWKRRRTP